MSNKGPATFPPRVWRIVGEFGTLWKWTSCPDEAARQEEYGRSATVYVPESAEELARARAGAKRAELLEFIENEVHRLVVACMPHPKTGSIRRGAASEAMNIAMNLQALLSFRDAEQAESYGYKRDKFPEEEP